MASTPDTLCIYEGRVAHARHKPKRHKFSYKVFSFFADLDRLDEISRNHRFFSRNRFNIFSFYDRDHGTGGPADIAVYLRDQLAKAGLRPAARICALFYPRIFGYAFNPLVVFYCYDDAGRLSTIFYQVNNTFGERHTYLIPVDDVGDNIRQETKKLFHVSPFIDMNMRYQFKMGVPGDTLRLSILVSDPAGPILTAGFRGSAVPDAQQKTLLGVLARHPLMMVKVIGGIHWEAVKLLAKGLRLRAGTPTPVNPVTLVKSV